MARTALTNLTLLGSYPTLQPVALSATLTLTGNATPADGVSFPMTGGKQVLIVQNTDAGAQTCTIESVPDARKRLGEITAYAMAAGAIAVFGPFEFEGWKQSDGTLYCKGSVAGVKFAMVNVP